MATLPVDSGGLHYEEHGSGPPLLLVDGTGADGAIRQPAEHVAREARVVVDD